MGRGRCWQRTGGGKDPRFGARGVVWCGGRQEGRACGQKLGCVGWFVGRAGPPTGQRPLVCPPLPAGFCSPLASELVSCCWSLCLSSNPNCTLLSHLIALGLNTFTSSSLPIIRGSGTNCMAHDKFREHDSRTRPMFPLSHSLAFRILASLMCQHIHILKLAHSFIHPFILTSGIS